MLICPSTEDTPATGPTTQAVIQDMAKPGHLSYIYLGRGLTNGTSEDTIVLYELPTNHNGQGCNFLFADTHVRSLKLPAAMQVIAELNAGHNPPRPEVVTIP